MCEGQLNLRSRAQIAGFLFLRASWLLAQVQLKVPARVGDEGKRAAQQAGWRVDGQAPGQPSECERLYVRGRARLAGPLATLVQPLFAATWLVSREVVRKHGSRDNHH